MVRKTAKGPLSRVELVVLQALVKRHVKSASGTHILKVPAHGRHHTYIRTAMAKKIANKVSSRQVYRRMDAVQQFSNLHGASPDGTALIQKKLSGRWADAKSYQVNVPQLGTFELCCDMRASNCQLQVMRSHLTSWDFPCSVGGEQCLNRRKSCGTMFLWKHCICTSPWIKRKTCLSLPLCLFSELSQCVTGSLGRWSFFSAATSCCGLPGFQRTPW